MFALQDSMVKLVRGIFNVQTHLILLLSPDSETLCCGSIFLLKGIPINLQLTEQSQASSIQHDCCTIYD